MPKLRTIRTIRNRFLKKQDLPEPEFGILGNGQGVVAVPDKPNYVYVRLGNQVAEVYSVRITAKYGETVAIGVDPMDPHRRQVLSVCTRQTEDAGIHVAGSGYAPARRYQWMATNGGEDPLYVALRQFLPLRVSPAGGMSISIYPGMMKIGGVWVLRAFEVLDLSSYVPETEGKALLALISINTSGASVVTVGDEVDIADLTDLSDAPATPADTLHEPALVRLYYGQVVIREARTNSDLYDLRMPYMVNLTNDLVGLGNVTNVKQLTVSPDDWSQFALKEVPTGDDVLLIEDKDGATPYSKKRVLISKLPSTGGEGSLDVKDGTTSVLGVDELTFSGATVSETASGKATVNITGGGSAEIPSGLLVYLNENFR
jgi:hypothetical protein